MKRTDLTTAEQWEFRNAYSRRSDAWLAKRFGITQVTVRAYASVFRLAKDKSAAKRHGVKVSMPRWTDAEIRTLKRVYSKVDNLEVARIVNRSVKSVVSQATRLGLRKTKKRLTEMGRTNRAKRH